MWPTGGPAAAAATKVLLRFDMPGMQMNKPQAEAAASGGERYTVRGNFTTMGGRWHIEVVLRRAGFDDVRHTFEVDILRGAPFVIEKGFRQLRWSSSMYFALHRSSVVARYIAPLH
ncbi:MAG: hypothetical protein U0Z44_01195 [Kouleothrix sp.]